MNSHFTRASPFGCVVGFAALMTLGLSIYCWVSLFRAFDIEDPEMQTKAIGFLWKSGAATLLAAIGLLVITRRMLAKVDMSNPNDPDRQKIRF